MVWIRSAGGALIIHLILLGVFTFTLSGNPEDYKTDVVFLGSILRVQEVVPVVYLFHTPVIDDGDRIALDTDKGKEVRRWRQGIVADKPDFSPGALSLGDERIFRFSGERVELDGEEASFVEKEEDMGIPAPVPFKLRLGSP